MRALGLTRAQSQSFLYRLLFVYKIYKIFK